MIDKDFRNRGEIVFHKIGVIHSPFRRGEPVPIQPIFAEGAEGKVEVYPEYAAGLEGLSDFRYIYIVYDFHLSEGFSLKAKPYLGKEEKGIFSIRSPRRPNGIGISIVRLISIINNEILVKDIDVIDGTPLLDIKPYVEFFDNRADANNGWLDSVGFDRTNSYKGK